MSCKKGAGVTQRIKNMTDCKCGTERKIKKGKKTKKTRTRKRTRRKKRKMRKG